MALKATYHQENAQAENEAELSPVFREGAIISCTCITDYPVRAYGINLTVYHDIREWGLSIHFVMSMAQSDW